MSESSSSNIKCSHYLAYALYRTFEFTLRLLPLEVVWVIGYGLGLVGWICVPKRRRTVIRNLRIVYGKKLSHTEVRYLARKTFHHAGANLLCSFQSATMDKQDIRDRVEVSHIERTMAVRDQGNGGILLLAHMGNWELLAQFPVILRNHPRFGTLYRPLDNPLIDRLVRKRRQDQDVRTYSRRDGFFKPITHLKEGGFLGTIADQHAGRHGMAIPLFGKLSSITNLPALLHRRSGASIIPIAMCTTGAGRWRLEILPILDIPKDQRRNTYEATRTTTSLYERIMLESPADVIWMHGYWKVGKKRPLNIDGVQQKGDASSTLLPFRVLVFTGDFSTDNEDAIAQLKRLKSYRSDIHITTVGQHPIYPDADHHIACDHSSPPHLVSNAIRSYDLELESPLDCALDFTPDGSGGKLCARAGMDRVFCRSGKWVSRRSRTVFGEKQDNSIALFLTSLGLDDQSASS